MSYAWLNDLDHAFNATGIPYVEIGYSGADPTGALDWRTRGRPASTGAFEPCGVLCHHTASPAGTSPQADINVLLAGNSEAPGPVAQLYIGRDAMVYIIAAGRANHGGKGMRPGIDASCADMNAKLLGIEVGNNGVGEYWSDDQTTLYAQTVAGLCEWYGWDTDAVYLHATTGPPNGGCNSKIDPAGPWQREPLCSSTWNLDIWRGFVDEQRGLRPPAVATGGMVLSILQCSDAWAGFLGFTWNGIAQTVEWVDGDTAAWYKSLGCPVQDITVAQCSGMTLMGSLPQGDGAYNWTGDEFRRVIS